MVETIWKNSNRWESKLKTGLFNDYQSLMAYLMIENYEKGIEYREKYKEFDNVTRLERIKDIWEIL